MANSPSTEKLRVLVVDDHDISREFTVAALRQFTADVKEAASLHAADKLLATWRPDVALVDLELPDGNGLQWIQGLGERWPEAQDSPRFIAMTGYRSGAAAGRGESPLIPLLIKPVAISRLKSAVLGEATDPVVMDPPERHKQSLLRLFRDELDRDLPELETAIARHDRAQAAFILHRLIAACALCGQTALGDAVRALDEALRGPASGATIASTWLQVLKKVEGLPGR
jgi:CheY-like chemotaxis protein